MIFAPSPIFPPSPNSSKFLKDVLQGKLQDSSVLRRADNTEGVAPKIRARSIGPETVRNIEGFRSDFHSLVFMEAECSGQCHIEGPVSRTSNAVTANIASCADVRNRESGRTEIASHRAAGVVAKRAAADLVRPLIHDPVQ